jgi:hypothetical protein
LPTEYRPTRFGTEEGALGASDRLEDSRYRQVLADVSTPCFLFADKCRFDVTPSFRSDYATVFVEPSSDMSDDACKLLVDTMMSANASFAFACADAEYLCRNRYVARFGANNIEAWVGRDLGRYLPGVYWYTAFNQDAVAFVDIRSLNRIGAQRSEAARGVFRIEMPDGPGAWRLWDRELDAILCSAPGVFSLSRIRPELEGAPDLGGLLKLLAMWR